MSELSYQLYCSRNFGPMAQTLRMVSDIGYKNVEGYGALYADADAVAATKAGLAETGLAMPSGHFGLDQVAERPAEVLDIADALNIGSVFVPYIDNHVRSAEEWRSFGEQLAEAGRPIWDAGRVFGWHNHAFEFVALPDGSFPIEHILSADEQLAFEFDVAWAARAGQDPVPWMEKFKSRLKAAHIKDLAPEGEKLDEDGWADVGHGTMDWAGLSGALVSAGATLFVIEHDNPSDDRRFAKASFDTCTSF